MSMADTETTDRNAISGRPGAKDCSVALVIPGSFLGGAEQQFLYLAARLPQHGFDISVTCFFDEPLVPLLRQAGMQTYVVPRAGRRTWQDPQRFLALARHLRRLRPQIIHTWLFEANVYGTVAAMLIGKRDRLLVSERGTALSTDRPGTNALQRLSCRLATGVVVNSRAGAAQLQRSAIPGDRIHYIPNGLPSQRVRVTRSRHAVRGDLGIPESAPVFVMVGRMYPQKDHRTLLLAMAALPARDRHDAHLVLVGSGALESKLRQECDQLHLGACVHFVGEQRLPSDFIAASDVAVLSSCGGEGQSNFLIEALALGMPIVATRVGGNAEVLAGTDSILVPPNSSDALAVELERALSLNRSTAACELRKQAALRFDIDYSVAALASVYRSIAALETGTQTVIPGAVGRPTRHDTLHKEISP